MISCQREILYGLKDEAAQLLQLNHAELTLHAGLHLNPKWAQYATLEKLGMLTIFTARDDGKLVGYSAFFISDHLQYDLRHASNTVLFLDPAYRHGGIGYRFIRFCDAELTRDKAELITWHIKAGHDFSPVLKRMGYAHEETIFSKYLKKESHGN